MQPITLDTVYRGVLWKGWDDDPIPPAGLMKVRSGVSVKMMAEDMLVRGYDNDPTTKGGIVVGSEGWAPQAAFALAFAMNADIAARRCAYKQLRRFGNEQSLLPRDKVSTLDFERGDVLDLRARVLTVLRNMGTRRITKTIRFTPYLKVGGATDVTDWWGRSSGRQKFYLMTGTLNGFEMVPEGVWLMLDLLPCPFRWTDRSPEQEGGGARATPSSEGDRSGDEAGYLDLSDSENSSGRSPGEEEEE